MNRFILILSTLTFGSCGSVEAGELPPATALEARAARFLDEGEVEEARALFLQAIQQTRRPFLACVGLARCAIRQGDGPTVTWALEQAYSAAPRSPAVQELLGRTHLEAAKASSGGMRVQHATTAGSLFAAASRQSPELPNLAYHTGLASLLAGRPREAVTFLEFAVAQAPGAEDPLHALALGLSEAGAPERAVALLEAQERSGPLAPGLLRELQRARALRDQSSKGKGSKP